MNWKFSNNKIIPNKSYHFKQVNDNLFLIYNKSIILKDINNTSWIFIDGYILPRHDCYNVYKDVSPEELVIELFKKYGLNFIDYIKGVFSIIIKNNNKIFVFVDRHSIKKIFYKKTNDSIIVSNEIKDITKLELDRENAAIFILLSHYLPGSTMFKDVNVIKAGSYLVIENNYAKEEYYWKLNELMIKRKPFITDFNKQAELWKNIISEYVEYISPKKVSITLTGGNDSRMVLAALISLNIPLNAFSYGNPDSEDVKISELISNKANINYKNYFLSNSKQSEFKSNVNEIIYYGNTLINLHRAHRNQAIKMHHEDNPNNDMIFTGLVGGEYIKGAGFDNIVLPKLFDQINNKENYIDKILYLKELLIEKGICVNKIDVNIVLNRIESFLNLAQRCNSFEKKFIYTYYYYGAGHHTQDSNVFAYHLKNVVNPFMDIDFIEILIKSDFWHLNDRKNKFLKKLFGSYYHVKITDILAPKLSNIPYAKKGQYTAQDMLNNKLRYIYSRGVDHFKSKSSVVPNFPMGKWLYNYCKTELDILHEDISIIFRSDFCENKLEEIKKYTNETKWHDVTNIINLNLNYNDYL